MKRKKDKTHKELANTFLKNYKFIKVFRGLSLPESAVNVYRTNWKYGNLIAAHVKQQNQMS